MTGLDATTGRAITGIDHLRQSVRDILTTRIGTRVMRRHYGSRVPELVDNPITPRLAVEVYAAVAGALLRWEPRLRLTRVRITSATAGSVTLTLEGVYLPDARPVTIAGLEVSS